MRLESLKPAEGSTKNRKRVGRGQGSGRGGTSTRGHKGAQSRSGYSRKTGFEGGQMPLQRRVPKFGFKNNNKVVSKPINLDDLQKLSEAKKLKEVTLQVLIDNGLAQKNDIVKVLGRGELKTGLKVTAHKFSKTAQEAIEKAGGSITVVE
ncbi:MULTISPECIES: 50S ribosomal protein L15 [unclassified Ekhidna]|jgi:large subunit ribosomal protein L15|uniref:50S ribosomal protein L15 n=1 Tax=unclassified Ekhidna TaxID=2632188 RepID=UPI0032DF4717